MTAKMFERTEDGITSLVSSQDGLTEINAAMMGEDKRTVRTMSAGSGRYDITYKDGRRVLLVLVDAPEADEPADEATLHVVSVRGGKVHTLMPGAEEHPYPLCRGGGMNQMLTAFRTTSAPLSCTHCIEYARRRAAKANPQV